MHNEEDVNCDEIGGLNCRKASADTILAELEKRGLEIVRKVKK